MSKQEIKRKETQIATKDGVGQLSEQSVTVDDNYLPSPQELDAYKQIDPQIIDYILDASRKEQNFRHQHETLKLEVIKSDSKRNSRMNWWGQFFVFLTLIALICAAIYSLYLNRPWFATIFTGGLFVTAISVFVPKKDIKGKQ